MSRKPLLSREQKLKSQERYVSTEPRASALEAQNDIFGAARTQQPNPFDEASPFINSNTISKSKGPKQAASAISRLEYFIQNQPKARSKAKSSLTRVLDPENLYLRIWQLLNLVCILYYFAELPISLTFEKNYRKRDETGYLFEAINMPSIFLFIVNMLVKSRTSYYQRGLMISEPRAIVLNYLKFAFFLDLIAISSIIPSEVAQLQEDTDSSTGIDRSLSTMSLLFYLKFYEVREIYKNINRTLQLHRRLKACFNLVFLLLSILLICNAYACIFYSISESYCATHPSPDPSVPMCWIDAVYASGLAISEHKWYIKYVFSLYWASTTMISVGYGDITAHNVNEALFVILAEFTSCFVFAYSLNQIWAITIQMSEKKNKYQRKVNIVNRYMRDKDIVGSTRSKVNAYLGHFYRHEKLRDVQQQNQILAELAPALREELMMGAYGFIFQDFPVFKGFSEQLFCDLVYKIREQRYAEAQLIAEPTDEAVDNSLCYLFKGQALLQLRLNRKTLGICTIATKELLGEFQFFTGSVYRTTVVAKSYCLAYTISRQAWDSVIQQYYEDLERFHQIKDSALYLRDIRPLKIKCRFCHASTHITELCLYDKLKNEHLTFIRSYRGNQNIRTPGYQRQSYKTTNPLEKRTRNELKALREIVINRSTGRQSLVASEAYRFSTLSEGGEDSDRSEGNGSDDADNRGSVQFDFVVKQANIVKKKSFSRQGKLMKKSKSIQNIQTKNKSNNSQQSQGQREVQVNSGQQVPVNNFQKNNFNAQNMQQDGQAYINSLIVGAYNSQQARQQVDIDTKESYQYYFCTSNLENIIYQSRAVPQHRVSRTMREWMD